MCGIVTDHIWWSEYYKTQSQTPVNDMSANETVVHTIPSTSMIRLTSHQKNQTLRKLKKGQEQYALAFREATILYKECLDSKKDKTKKDFYYFRKDCTFCKYKVRSKEL